MDGHDLTTHSHIVVATGGRRDYAIQICNRGIPTMESALDSTPPSLFLCRFFFSIFSSTARVFPHSGNGSISLISSPPPLRRGASNVKFAPLLFSPLPFLSFFICETYDGIASREIKNGGKGGRNLPPRHSLGKIHLFLLKMC